MMHRNEFTHINLLSELRDEPCDYNNNYLRTNEEDFNRLRSMVSLLIMKQDTQMRSAISPQEIVRSREGK